MPFAEYEKKWAEDIHFRNREGAADKKDKKRKEFIAYLEDNSDWKQFHLSGKKAEEQEPNNAAQDHTKEVANELIDGGDIDPSALEAAQDIISEGSGINHGEPVEIVPGTENDVGRGDNVRVLKFDKEDSAQTPEERREIVQASLTDHAEKVATVVELPDGRFLVKFNAGTSDADVDNVVSLHGLEHIVQRGWQQKVMLTILSQLSLLHPQKRRVMNLLLMLK